MLKGKGLIKRLQTRKNFYHWYVTCLFNFFFFHFLCQYVIWTAHRERWGLILNLCCLIGVFFSWSQSLFSNIFWKLSVHSWCASGYWNSSSWVLFCWLWSLSNFDRGFWEIWWWIKQRLWMHKVVED